jgi:hypothetical protein
VIFVSFVVRIGLRRAALCLCVEILLPYYMDTAYGGKYCRFCTEGMIPMKKQTRNYLKLSWKSTTCVGRKEESRRKKEEVCKRHKIVDFGLLCRNRDSWMMLF